jgi:hypothetical protein
MAANLMAMISSLSLALIGSQRCNDYEGNSILQNTSEETNTNCSLRIATRMCRLDIVGMSRRYVPVFRRDFGEELVDGR